MADTNPHPTAYHLYARENVDNCERPLREVKFALGIKNIDMRGLKKIPTIDHVNFDYNKCDLVHSLGILAGNVLHRSYGKVDNLWHITST